MVEETYIMECWGSTVEEEINRATVKWESWLAFKKTWSYAQELRW